MLQIFHVPRTRSLRIVWLAEEMGLPYELKVEQFGKPSAEFTAANPVGAFPAIRDGEVAMGESAAIMHYMTERYGPTPLAPRPNSRNYPDYLQFLVFGEGSMAAFLNPVLMTQFMAPEDQKQNFTVDAAKSLFKGRLRAIDAQLEKGDYMAGDFTAADISVGYSLGLGEMLGIAGEYSDPVRAYADRLKGRPAYQAAAAK
jgi:glutathione S-transferase